MAGVVVVELVVVARSTERRDDQHKQESGDCCGCRCCRKESIGRPVRKTILAVRIPFTAQKIVGTGGRYLYLPAGGSHENS